jgi:hypothetical protein
MKTSCETAVYGRIILKYVLKNYLRGCEPVRLAHISVQWSGLCERKQKEVSRLLISLHSEQLLIRRRSRMRRRRRRRRMRRRRRRMRR